MPLSTHQQALLDDLMVIEDLQERLGSVVDRARSRPALPESLRTEANRVIGCQSQVWVVRAPDGDSTRFLGDSDSPLVRGLVVLTCDFFSGEDRTLSDRLAAGVDPIELLGLARSLSQTRRNGLLAVRARLLELARFQG